MKSTLYALICLILTATGTVRAQKYGYYLSDSLILLNSGNQNLPFGLSGGYHCPQFSPCDLNDDKKKDIVIYDKLDGSVSTYINTGGTGEVKYELDMRYAAYFPKLRAFGWMLMRDFNNDGYEDIFTAGALGYTVYKNISYTVSGRPEFQELPLLQYRNFSPTGSLIEYNVLSTPSIHLPGIYDIDFDGDLDILSYSNVGGAIDLYQNYQVELGLPPDSIRLFHNDMCWGYFNDYDCNAYILGTCSKNKDYRKYGPRHTNGSSITLFDANDDGDIDLLIGNEGCSHMTMLYNAKPDNTMQYDSFYMYDTNYVSTGNRADISIYPAAYFMDVDNDGKRDLIYAPNSTNTQYIIEEKNQIRWFKNTGTDLAPQWAQQQPLFTSDILDMGKNNQWACYDWDGDGDLDCLAATNGNAYETGDSADRIYLYENTGTPKAARLKLLSTNFGNFIPEKIKNLSIAIADMNSDGKPDLVCGNNRGEILYYRNTSSGNTLNPTFVRANSSFPGFNIDIGGFSAPAVADINGDGLKDLVIGRSDSMLSYYRNTGTPANPDFSIVTSRFGGIKPIDSIAVNYLYDDTGAVIGYFPIYEKNIYGKPVIADIDGDDTLEIIVGNSLGIMRMYKINGSKPTSDFEQIDSFYWQPAFQNRKFFKTDLGSHIAPCLADFNGDSVPELMVSCNRGGIRYLKNTFKYSHKTGINSHSYSFINTYPNPAGNTLEFNTSGFEVLQLEVFNTLGQNINVPYSADANTGTVDVSRLESGFYILNLMFSDGRRYASRFQVIH